MFLSKHAIVIGPTPPGTGVKAFAFFETSSNATSPTIPLSVLFIPTSITIASFLTQSPLGCYLLIKKIEPNLNGKKAVIIGRSNLNGKPMTQLLLKENCTVTITHSRTKDLKAECLEADIIVAAVGIPELVKGDWVKKDTIVIDVGINKTDKGIVGDVDFDEVSKNAKALTPVPGGVGPMTIACLLKNTIDCFKRSQI